MTRLQGGQPRIRCSISDIRKRFPVLNRVPGAKRPECDSDYSSQPNTEVMNVWGCSHASIDYTETNPLSHIFIKSRTFLVV